MPADLSVRILKLLAVIRACGDAWNPSVPLEGQSDWSAHAFFMNCLQSESFRVLGCPLEGTPDVLVIVLASSSYEVVVRLQDDPWISRDLLRVSSISQWMDT